MRKLVLPILFCYLAQLCWQGPASALELKRFQKLSQEAFSEAISDWQDVDSISSLEGLIAKLPDPQWRQIFIALLNNRFVKATKSQAKLACKAARWTLEFCDDLARYSVDKGLEWFGSDQMQDDPLLRRQVSNALVSSGEMVLSLEIQRYLSWLPSIDLADNELTVRVRDDLLAFKIEHRRRDLRFKLANSDFVFSRAELMQHLASFTDAAGFLEQKSAELTKAFEQSRRTGLLLRLLGVQEAYGVVPLAIAFGIFLTVVALLILLATVYIVGRMVYHHFYYFDLKQQQLDDLNAAIDHAGYGGDFAEQWDIMKQYLPEDLCRNGEHWSNGGVYWFDEYHERFINALLNYYDSHQATDPTHGQWRNDFLDAELAKHHRPKIREHLLKAKR